MRDSAGTACRLAVISSLLLVSLAGCGKKIVVVQYPPFEAEGLETIAVMPFRNQTTVDSAGQIIADKLAAAMMANGSYTVYSRNDLRALTDEADLQLALGDGTATPTDFQRLTRVQAILTGSVNVYAGTTNSQRRREPVYGYTNNGKRYIQGYRDFVWTVNEANVSVTASLIRVRDGQTLYATPQAATARRHLEGSPPSKDCFALANEATTDVVQQLLEQFAPVRKEVRISPDAIKTASELYDNAWTYTDRFSRDTEKMYAVVTLPPICERNKFRLTVVRKDQREDLASQEFVWDCQYKSFGYVFSPREIAAKAGPGEYELKLYSGPEPVAKRAFRIE